jgi:GNAT superfamily N-acetyltransferase
LSSTIVMEGTNCPQKRTNCSKRRSAAPVTVKEMRSAPSTLVSGEIFALGDRTMATIRPMASGDAAALVRFHQHLSPASVRLRYFYPHLELGAAEVAHLTEVDGRDRVALVVERSGEIVAVGRYDRLDDPTQAEIAFVVADAFQHHGLATMLLHRLAARAKKAGICYLVAEVLVENTPMLSVFHATGYPTKSTISCGTVEIKMAIAPVPEECSET